MSNTTKPTARFITKQTSSTGATQKTYEMVPPLEGHQYVTLSAVHVFTSAPVGCIGLAGPETYIFPSSEDGTITDWAELSGSQLGTLDHEAVLVDLGYTVEK
jgi:hypothetical protein